ncbi:hypothetical protein [Paenibacillus elgii]|uniref:hypothetical protein n=1 Tax=Paenibacillus elgii TaxID=189691 RepID=UPI000248D372|nr:hypothetical protein [Paenibacillus elgii]
MNTRNDAIEGIINFLKSDKKSLLLTGTHQYEKHKIVLQTISRNIESSSTILFRGNSVQNFGTFFENHTADFKTGNGYKLGKHVMYLDTMNRTSWKKSKSNYDFGVIYPLDSVYKNSKRAEILDDMFDRCNKVFLVSWTDNLSYDYTKISNYYDDHIVFDALEERPDYHKRMLDSIQNQRGF